MTDIKPKDVDGEPICSVSDCNCHRVIESGIYCTKGGGNGETRVIHRPNSLCIPGLRQQRDELKKDCDYCGATFEEMMDERGAQIELMKCCGNCYTTRNWYWTSDCYCHRGKQTVTPRTVCPRWGFSKKKED